MRVSRGLPLGAALILALSPRPVWAGRETPYQIVEVQAKIHLFPAQNAIACVDTMTLRPGSPGPDRISFRLLRFYEVERASVNGRDARYKREGDSLRLTGLPRDTLLTLVLRYSGRLAFRSEFTLLTRDRAILREEEVMPHGNTVIQKARLSIEVPSDWEAVSVGRLVGRETLKDSVVYVREADQPVPSIGWICAGVYGTLGSDSGGIPVTFHYFAADSALAPAIVSLARNAVGYYDRTFSPYRFSNLEIIEVDDWLGGGNVLAVANPNMVLVKRLALRTEDSFNKAGTILPHEIAHQWWPMTVFVRDSDAAFLSEGMCDYSSLLFNSSRGTLSMRDSLRRHPLLRSLLLRAESGRDLPLEQKADLRSLPTHYLKASYVHHMLRRIIGDSAFFRLYREYAQRFAVREAGLGDFRALAEEISGRTLGWFFTEWVTSRGVPRLRIYNVKTAPAGVKWVTRGRVRVVGYEHFTALVDVGVESAEGTATAPVWLGQDSTGAYSNDRPFEISTSSKPFRAILDPGGNFLKHQKLPVTLADLRDPSDGLLIVGTRGESEHLLQLARADSALMEGGEWSVRIKPDADVTLGDLQGERVILYGRASENSVVQELAGKFALGFKGDSIAIPKGVSDTSHLAGETIFDSTLALVQCVESPYNPRGILTWVVPLSRGANPSVLPLEASWAVMRGKEAIGSGVWEVKDEETTVEIQR